MLAFVVFVSSYQYLKIWTIYSSVFIYWKNCISVQWETLYFSILFGNLMLNFRVKLNVVLFVKLKIINILNDFSPTGPLNKGLVGMDPKMFCIILIEITLNSLLCNKKYVPFLTLSGC